VTATVSRRLGAEAHEVGIVEWPVPCIVARHQGARMNITYRKRGQCVVGAAVALTMVTYGPRPARVFAQGAMCGTEILPGPPMSLQHIVFIGLENRSFDHLAGWKTSTQSQRYRIGNDDPLSSECATYALNGPNQPPDNGPCALPFRVPSYMGTANFGDPAHAIGEMKTSWNNGDNRGWLFVDPYTNNNMNFSHYAIGYYDPNVEPPNNNHIPYLTNLLTNNVVVTSYFSSMIA